MEPHNALDHIYLLLASLLAILTIAGWSKVYKAGVRLPPSVLCFEIFIVCLCMFTPSITDGVTPTTTLAVLTFLPGRIIGVLYFGQQKAMDFIGSTYGQYSPYVAFFLMGMAY